MFMVGSCRKEEVSPLVRLVQKKYVERNLSFDGKIKHCLILPGGGCSGCITEGIAFLKEHASSFSKGQTENIVVFTNIYSMKLLKRSLKNIDMLTLNSIVDMDNMYLVNCNEEIYPMVLYLDNGDIEKVEVQSPSKNGLENLKRELEK